MKLHFLTAIFCGALAAVSAASAHAQSMKDRVAVEVAAGFNRHIDSWSRSSRNEVSIAGRAGFQLGERVRLIGSLARGNQIASNGSLDHETYTASYGVDVYWDITKAHTIGVQYDSYRHYLSYWHLTGGGIAMKKDVLESETLSVSYDYYGENGSFGVALQELTSAGDNRWLTVEGEHLLGEFGRESRLYGRAFGSKPMLNNRDDGTVGIGLRAKLPKQVHMYVTAMRHSDGNSAVSFNLAKSFGAKAERIFRRD
ncbi:hypothetical protein [Leisingera sp. ANG-Vp]|uniref:hypothetical protein n=1 Tax=Leisingera sp. ANG-Vp TaxID=1577896 RepID=UPI001269C3B7|nr:hypothetical protein [Leisingera sp. ANG-Vp]